MALSGQCQPRLLSALMQEPYIRLSPPKSTGRCYFNLKWLSEYTHDEQPCGCGQYFVLLGSPCFSTLP